MSASKKLTCKGTLQEGVYLSEAQNPIPPPPSHCIRVYSILLHTGKGKVEELKQREWERGNNSQIQGRPT
jgi:hypothetical protein